MKRCSAPRRWARHAGSEAMSSRWISTSFRSGLPLRAEPELAAHLGVRRLDERRLAHAARAPQQRVVGGQALGEAARVVEQLLGGAVDALEQAERLAVDVRHGQEGLGRCLPDEGLRARRNRSPAAAAGPAARAPRQGGRGGREWPFRRSLRRLGRPMADVRKDGLRPRSIDECRARRHRGAVEVVANGGQDTIFRRRNPG